MPCNIDNAPCVRGDERIWTFGRDASEQTVE